VAERRTVGSGGGKPAARHAAQAACKQLLRLVISAAAVASTAFPAHAASDKVRITNLTDVAFGLVTNLSVDAVSSQSVCLYASTATNGYNVRASGSGPGGAFTLASGSDNLPFDVQWNSAAGQSNGPQLTANVALSGQVSAATQQTCNSGPATSASVIVILRTAALSSAAAGSYNGSVTLVIGPE
jgi:hypothetical protein